jgi:transcriptional regulator with XRE-family HTH domain
MEISGNQLRAARSLLGLEQIDLAAKAKVGVNTIRRMEANGSGALGGNESTRVKVIRSIESMGVEFTNGDQPGVRLKTAKWKSKSK